MSQCTATIKTVHVCAPMVCVFRIWVKVRSQSSFDKTYDNDTD